MLARLSRGPARPYSLSAEGSGLLRGPMLREGYSSLALQFDFNEPGAYPSGTAWGNPTSPLSVTRAADTATYLDLDNVLRSAPANTFRIGRTEPNGPVGLISEPQRTNTLLRSTAIDPTTYPTVWAAQANVVAAPVVTYGTADTTAPDGSQTVTKIDFPAVVGAGAASAVGQSFTATAVAWSGSLWLRTASGTATVYLYYQNAGTYYSVACAVTSTWKRFWLNNKTLTAATWSLKVGVDLADGTQVTQGAQTVYVWNAQSEAGIWATSDILTAGVSMTRNADLITTPNPFSGRAINSFSFCVTATPENGRPWLIQTPTTHLFVAKTAAGTANSSAAFPTASWFYWQTVDALGSVRQRAGGIAAGDTGTHRFVFQSGVQASDAMMHWIDGYPQIIAAVSGSLGNPTWGPHQPLVYFGCNTTPGGEFGGLISEFRLCRTSIYGKGGCI